MTKDTLQKEPPSQEDRFATVVSLCNAAEAGDLACTKQILKADPALATRPISQNGQLAIQLAAREGHVQIVETLLRHGADPRRGVYPNRGATSALAYARDRGYTAVVGAIEAHLREQPQVTSDLGDAERLTKAVVDGDLHKVREMLAKTPELANSEARPLLKAAESGQGGMVSLLLDAGAEADAPYELDLGDEGTYKNRGEPLWRAAAGDHYGVCRQLLEAGADPNAYVFASGPAAERAMENGNDEILDLIYSYGGKGFAVAAAMCGKIAVPAEVLSLKPEMASSIMGAAALGGNVELARLCIGHDLGDDWFGLLYQPMRGRARQAEQRYADGIRNEHADKIEILRMMLEGGANPNAKSDKNETALHRLSGETSKWSDEEKIPFARLLLNYGAGIDARDDELKSTPLGYAARYGHEKLAAFLVERGASPQLPDDEAWGTPIAWAEKQGHGAIAELLRRRMEECSSGRDG